MSADYSLGHIGSNGLAQLNKITTWSSNQDLTLTTVGASNKIVANRPLALAKGFELSGSYTFSGDAGSTIDTGSTRMGVITWTALTLSTDNDVDIAVDNSLVTNASIIWAVVIGSTDTGGAKVVVTNVSASNTFFTVRLSNASGNNNMSAKDVTILYSIIN